ncbi:MAG: hypothetical protein HY904_20405 [Deltaproteobacteria bacterium]|nr:hypothetical protein [Deltaproteobacteria bacterium]
MRNHVAGLALVVGAWGCSGGGGGGGGGDSVTAAQACDATAEALCGLYQRCMPWVISLQFGDLTTCQARSKLGCEDSFSANGTTATPAQTKACAEAYGSAACADMFSAEPPQACKDMPAGTLANGAQCGSGEQCQSERCKESSTSTCGTCVAPVTAGGSCANNEPCNDGLTCAPNATCVAPGAAGATCGNNSPCKDPLVCRGGTCGARVAAGAACQPDIQDCDLTGADWLSCDQQTNTCKVIALVGSGQTCGLVNNAYVMCAARGGCQASAGSTTGTCRAAAADGAACDENNGIYCMSPARCISGTCQLSNNQCG